MGLYVIIIIRSLDGGTYDTRGLPSQAWLPPWARYSPIVQRIINWNGNWSSEDIVNSKFSRNLLSAHAVLYRRQQASCHHSPLGLRDAL